MILAGFPQIPEREIDDRILPTSFFVDNLGGKLLINRVRESLPSNNRLLLDGINSESLGENEPLATENAGRRIVLDGTDADGTDANGRLTFENETGDGDIVLDVLLRLALVSLTLPHLLFDNSRGLRVVFKPAVVFVGIDQLAFIGC